MSTSSTSTDVPPAAPEQMCYIQCNFCNIVLAVSVPCSSLFDTVTVRCGNCSNIWPMNVVMAAAFHQSLTDSTSIFQYSYWSSHHQQGFNDIVRNDMTDLGFSSDCNNKRPIFMRQHAPPVTNAQEINNRHLEKRQGVPSLYNRFIKEEIQRIKAKNPDISHKEAFSTAAKNWAHYPRIQNGSKSENNYHHQANLHENQRLCNSPNDKA